MLWLKALHLIFMVTWFAGLFYLPRLYVYHRTAETAAEKARLEQMSLRLFIIMTIGGALTLVFGLALLVGNAAAYAGAGWLHAKLALVAALMAYHAMCFVLYLRAKRRTLGWSSLALKLFNELPAIALIGIILLAVLRPF